MWRLRSFSMREEHYTQSYLHLNQTPHPMHPFSQQMESWKLWVQMLRGLCGLRHLLTALRINLHCLRSWESNHCMSDCWTWNTLSIKNYRSMSSLKKYNQKWRDTSCPKLESHCQQTYILSWDLNKQEENKNNLKIFLLLFIQPILQLGTCFKRFYKKEDFYCYMGDGELESHSQ